MKPIQKITLALNIIAAVAIISLLTYQLTHLPQ